MAEILADPLTFCRLCWPDMKLHAKQAETLESVRYDIETYVHSANELGKTRLAALSALWFFSSRQPARVIVSSSSQSQLKSALWREIVHLAQTSQFAFPFKYNDLRIQKRVSPGVDDCLPLDYMQGLVTRTVESFQGHHLPHDIPRVLCVFDESSGVEDQFFEAAVSWAHRTLAIGNPLTLLTQFYRGCKAGSVPDPAGEARHFRKVIHMDGMDSPNVLAGMRHAERKLPGKPPVVIDGVLSYQEWLRRSEQWDEVQIQTRLRGQFYEGSGALLFPPIWLDCANKSHRKLVAKLKKHKENGFTRRARAMGIDTSQGASDLTVWTVVDEHGILAQIEAKIQDSMKIVSQTIALMQSWNLDAKFVAIDAGGGGKEVADRLRQLGHSLRVIYFGSLAGPSKAPIAPNKKIYEQTERRQAYKNKRAEMYGNLRIAIKPPEGEDDPIVFAIPEEMFNLRKELAVLPLLYDAEGRFFLPPKEAVGDQDSIRKLLGGASPDRADSLVLAIEAMRRASNASIAAPAVTEEDIESYVKRFEEMASLSVNDESPFR